MNKQATIRKILDAATAGNLAAAETALEEYSSYNPATLKEYAQIPLIPALVHISIHVHGRSIGGTAKALALTVDQVRLYERKAERLLKELTNW